MKGDRFSEALSARQLIELDACTRCGECLKYCPIQDVTGRPSISPPEKIRVFREFIRATEGLKAIFLGSKQIDPVLLEDFTRAVFECTTCGACGERCSVGIFTQRLWPMMRKEMVKRGIGPIGEQAKMPESVKQHGNPYNLPASERFRIWMPTSISIAERSHLAYYAGCTGAYSAQPMVRGDVLVLSAIGEPFTMLSAEQEVCCGFPLFISGQHDLLEGLVKRLVEAYVDRGVKQLLCSCPCCTNIMTRDWPALYGKPLPFKVRHITQFVVEAIEKGRVKISKPLGERLIYHDPCYLSRGVGIIEEPRYILSRLTDKRLIEFERHGRQSHCCGAGGAARKVFKENAYAMARNTIDEAIKKGADRLILNCPACYALLNEAQLDNPNRIVITDLMELLASLLG